MAYWWVNHRQTRDLEVRGGHLWSPKSNRNGARNQTYDNMLRAKAGDTVYLYAHGRLGAIGAVIRAASPCPKPVEFGTVGDYWNNDGWLLQIAFTPINPPVRPSDHIRLIAPLLPGSTLIAPLQRPRQSRGVPDGHFTRSRRAAERPDRHRQTTGNPRRGC